VVTASAPHKGTRETNTSTNHLPHHKHHERRNTHYGACSAWFVVVGYRGVTCGLSTKGIVSVYSFVG
jgi:hypothetical protein